jgi:hypothetical protein
MFSKLLTLILLIAVVWYGYRYVVRINARMQAKQKLDAQDSGLPRPHPNAEEMIRCPVCNVYVSATKATSCGRPDCPYR